MQQQSQSSFKPHEIRPELQQLLNLQYKTNKFTSPMTFSQMINTAINSLKTNLYYTLYQLSNLQANKYGMSNLLSQQQPIQHNDRVFLDQLATVCEKVIEEPQKKCIQEINNFVMQDRLHCLQLNKEYKIYELHFRYMNLKQALVYISLSQCNVWYTICKTRKKSQKQFDLDPLIQYFDRLVKKYKFDNPYHIDILPKKQVKHIEKKINQQKVGNPLFEAVTNQDHNLVKQLLLKGAKIQSPAFLNNRQRAQVRCVHRACLNGDLRMCKLLDSFGANWQAQDNEKMTPIFYAIQSSNMDVIRYLVEELKVNIQKQETQSRTPFYWACTQGDINIIDYFYKAGCNINQKSELGRTALSKSCYLGRRDIVLYLLNCKQIDMFSQCTKGRTALHNAVFGPKGGRQGHKFGTNQKDSPQCAQILLQKGMHVDIQDKQHCTPLHIAMSSQAIDSIRLLMAYSASLTALNDYNETPLMTGAKFGHVQACRILVQQYGADILCLDKFGKNLLLLTAKFQQNSEDGTLNPAFLYFLQPFVNECIKVGQMGQLYRTFREIIGSQFSQKMLIETIQLWKAYKKFGVTIQQLSIQQIQSMLKVCLKCSTYLSKHQNEHNHNQVIAQEFPHHTADHYRLYLQLATDVLRSLALSEQSSHKLYRWLITNNQPKILQYVHQKQLLQLHKVQITEKEYFEMFQSEQLQLKQKIISFCLLSLNFDWIKYRKQDKSNILHLLVRKQKSSTILQLFKALSNKIPKKILTNPHLSLSSQSQKLVLKQLLQQKDQSNLDAYQLSLILKNKSIGKLIQQKLKEEHFQFSNVLDVKEYRAVVENDGKELEVFNMGHQREEQLGVFQEWVAGVGEQGIKEWWGWREQVREDLGLLKGETGVNQPQQKFWKMLQQRPLNFLKKVQQLQILKQIQYSPVIGIDIQYFTSQSITLISILQLSTLSQDYILDCLSVPLSSIKPYIQPLFHNARILKILHGADNDLILLKSLFNLSLINFVDTSRLDIELRSSGNDLRGLATLVKQYLCASMSKEYQVSQWRIRPIPKAMLQYAKKDSSILPYLLAQMLSRIQGQTERIRGYILGGCKQCRRNKKASQPLIKAIQPL